jgi:hypothetical protein
VTSEPVHLRLPRLNVSHRHIAIRDHSNGDALITAIEVFSPTNKIDAAGRRKYLKKRTDYFDAGINLVEIDLLRSGRHLIDVPLDELAESLRTPYKACVHLGEGFATESAVAEKEFYPMPLRQRLAGVQIPLRPEDPNVILDLQQALDRTYDLGRFWMRIDYTQQPVPPLSPDDQTWANELIRQWERARQRT